MLNLCRTVRFAVGAAVGSPGAFPRNSYAGHPSFQGLASHYELDITCRGDADAITGYFLNITQIDAAVRASAIGLIARAATNPGASIFSLLADIVRSLTDALPTLHRVRWRLTPTFSIEMERSDMSFVLMRQSFEFAAAHRLHVASLSDEENRELFGKCNNAAGHGHNYRVEPCVRIALANGAPCFTLNDLERLTDATVIDHLDHKHLNKDVPEFAEMNPSVENIAKVCFNRLAPAIGQAGAELKCVTVWETEKTSCVYPAD